MDRGEKINNKTRKAAKLWRKTEKNEQGKRRRW
jgi:hypothetical protein